MVGVFCYIKHMEMLDILDSEGKATGKTKSRKEVHQKGLWHKSVHIWIINKKGDILLQKRSMKKESNPGKWDISVAGHLSAGQTSIEGALREIGEEIGLKIDSEELRSLGTIRIQRILNEGTYINNEFDDVYLLEKDIDLSKIKLQEEEVEKIEFVSPEQLKKMADSMDPALVDHKEEYDLLFRSIV